MKKVILILAAAVCCGMSVKAQTWKGAVTHNGYYCHSLNNADNITVYAAKGVEDYTGEVLAVKISVPFDWGNTGTGDVQVFQENLATGEYYTQQVFCHYHNGWLYYTEFLHEWCGSYRRGKYPCHSYTITLYENNDGGSKAGRKLAVNLYLNNLNTSQMIMNKQAFDTYW
jgi:hypothetical protein